MNIKINDRPIKVQEGTSVAAVLMSAGICSRKSLKGESRAPLCGMGICFECRAEIDGELYERTCMTLCREGMEVRTT